MGSRASETAPSFSSQSPPARGRTDMSSSALSQLSSALGSRPAPAGHIHLQNLSKHNNKYLLGNSNGTSCTGIDYPNSYLSNLIHIEERTL